MNNRVGENYHASQVLIIKGIVSNLLDESWKPQNNNDFYQINNENF